MQHLASTALLAVASNTVLKTEQLSLGVSTFSACFGSNSDVMLGLWLKNAESLHICSWDLQLWHLCDNACCLFDTLLTVYWHSLKLPLKSWYLISLCHLDSKMQWTTWDDTPALKLSCKMSFCVAIALTSICITTCSNSCVLIFTWSITVSFNSMQDQVVLRLMLQVTNQAEETTSGQTAYWWGLFWQLLTKA